MPSQEIENFSILHKMVHSLMNQVSKAKFIRVEVNFKIDEHNIDTFIGRTAHILLVECDPFI